jgi:apolipoprotein N-acyltransferase
MTTNFYYGKSVINDYSKEQNINLDTTIKIISPKIKIDRFFQSEDPSIIINELIELSEPGLENTIFVFPEGILTGIFLEDINIYKNFFKDSFLSNHKILLGINSSENSKIYNSMVVLDNNLNILSKYNKNKLVPFGEFLPFENILLKIGLKKITQGYVSFSSSNDRKILEINNIKFLPLICYEIIYSGKLNKSGEEFNFIVNISEDGWFGDSIGPDQHFSHSIFRSIEEGKNLIRSVNSGISVYIDASGKVINKIKTTERGVIEVKSYKKTPKTFFSTQGNKIFLYFLIFYITLIFFIKKKEII